MLDDGVDESHRLGPEVAPAVLPLVVLLGEDHPDQADHARPGREDPDDRGPALDLLVEPLERVGAPDLAAVGLGKCEVSEEIGLGIKQEPSDSWEARFERVDDPAELLACRSPRPC